MNNKNILLNLLLISFSITTVNLQSAAPTETEIKENIQSIYLDEIVEAIWYDEQDLVLDIIQNKLTNLNAKDRFSRGALNIMAQEGLIDFAKLLLEKGADVNIKNINDWTPLMEVAKNGFFDIAKLLLEYGADVNLKDCSGKTALMYAAQWEKVEILEMLLKNGANVNAKDTYGDTALIHAAQFNKVESAKILLKYGADVNVKLKHSSSALIIASIHNYYKLVNLFLEYDADIDTVNEFGFTALKIATNKKFTTIFNAIKNKQLLNEYREKIFKTYEQNDIKTCKLLLNDLKINFPSVQPFLKFKNKEKNSLLHEAVIKRDYAFIDYILKDNPEILSNLLYMPNKNGMTPIDLSATDEYLLKYFMNFAYASISESAN